MTEIQKCSKLAIASFISGLLGYIVVVLSLEFVGRGADAIGYYRDTLCRMGMAAGCLLWGLALVLGVRAIRKIGTKKGKVFAIIGIILGGMPYVLMVMLLAKMLGFL
ncbi:MAG: hypothetical protein V1701_11355 [Planctomycetota bacterium]